MANGNASGVTILNVTGNGLPLGWCSTPAVPACKAPSPSTWRSQASTTPASVRCFALQASICDTQFQPVVKLKNLGEATLTSVRSP
ncbi:MAG: hypothetical protein IPN38_04790 [Flavobacteriales bacterium]|nr:hypothetical protein [Flavobacteriales bacterium]